MICKKIIVLLSVFFTSSMLFATENIFYHGNRPMAMGGAFVAVGDDYNARNWNPASLATVGAWDLTFEAIPKITKDISDELIKTMNNEGLIKDTSDAVKTFQDNTSGNTNLANAQPLFDLINGTGGNEGIADKIMEGGTEFYFGTAIKPWKLSLGVSGNLIARTYIIKSAMASNPFFPAALSMVDYQIAYNLSADVVPTVGKAFIIKELVPIPNFLSEGDHTDRDLNLGFNFKYLNRGKFEDSLTIGSLGNTSTAKLPTSGDLPLATGMGLDIGTIVKFNEYLNLGLNVQDIGLTKIVYSDKSKAEFSSVKDEEFPTNVRIGAAFKPLKFMNWKTKVLDMTLAADLDNLNGKARESTDFMDKTHLGFETKFSLWHDFLGLGVRAGMNQGFPSYGVTVNTLWFFSLQYTMYGTELTDYQNISAGVVF